MILDLQNNDFELETMKRNAIVIPIPIVQVILSSPEQSPATLAILILNKLKIQTPSTMPSPQMTY